MRDAEPTPRDLALAVIREIESSSPAGTLFLAEEFATLKAQVYANSPEFAMRVVAEALGAAAQIGVRFLKVREVLESIYSDNPIMSLEELLGAMPETFVQLADVIAGDN